ncbi:helix-turn-helix domain-containing protein [Granulicella sp. L60]|uniref:helix-turn-helix domain-containing protein n=1 Tax=Granulicella sp. L60 TaxID=1641866 RepID=UPI002110953F|nr:helix-turn-helix transcriptional regulator [Granulicella sp. L60]
MAHRIPPEGPTLEQAIGQVLRKERLNRGLKQVEVSAATNFSVRSIGKMENGRQSMTIRSLDALAMFYGLPIEEVIIRAKQLRDDSL